MNEDQQECDSHEITKQIAKLKEEIETYINAESKEINQLKSTLDKIKTLHFKTSLCSDYRDYWEAWDKLGSILSKHEDEK